MSMDRREFLKIAGFSTIGIGVGWILSRPGEFLEASQFLQTKELLKAKQWAMVVDMRRFKTEEDYRKVIDACHKIHNVPDFGNPKDEIKWIWADTFEHAFPGQENEFMPESMKHKPFILLCNHCENPPCVRVCPTKATFKRKDGITMQDLHRCIGCRYCMAACPFGARSFNYRDPRPAIKEPNPEYPTRMIGVVEKCTFCEERLAKGQIPACVEASNGALTFGDIADPNSEVRRLLNANYTIRRKAELGTRPVVYYILDIPTSVVSGGESNA
ncbi:4Fe-4S ferredoxin [hot springs metagenome]|uniref:4Fe-4S ferredoxin n=1 Tax=hot springs metagenome TaxID=433727 RepID=A0A5J4L795_9ZZZZ